MVVLPSSETVPRGDALPELGLLPKVLHGGGRQLFTREQRLRGRQESSGKKKNSKRENVI